MSRSEVVEPDDEGNAVRRKTSFEVELCLEEGLSPVYKEGERPVSKMKEMGSKKRELLSSIISVGKKHGKPATRRESRKEEGIRRDETEEVRIEVNEEALAVVSREVSTENTKKVGTERTKQMGTENSEEVKSG